MTNRTAWLLGVGSVGLVAYGAWRAWNRRASMSPAEHDDRMVTEASEESFPASDAPSYTPIVRSSA